MREEDVESTLGDDPQTSKGCCIFYQPLEPTQRQWDYWYDSPCFLDISRHLSRFYTPSFWISIVARQEAQSTSWCGRQVTTSVSHIAICNKEALNQRVFWLLNYESLQWGCWIFIWMTYILGEEAVQTATTKQIYFTLESQALTTNRTKTLSGHFGWYSRWFTLHVATTVAWPNQPSFKQKIPISFSYSAQPMSVPPGVVQTRSKPQWDAAEVGPIFQKAVTAVICLISNLIHKKGTLVMYQLRLGLKALALAH